MRFRAVRRARVLASALLVGHRMTRRPTTSAATRPARPRRAAPKSRRSTRRAATAIAPAPPKIDRLGFTCFRLVPLAVGTPGTTPYAAIRLRETRAAMGVFAFGTRR
jgi:hypothetical protein